MTSYSVEKTDAEWQASLTPEQYQVCRRSATERPFSGAYYHHKEDGTYRCVCCRAPLFSSGHKFDSGSGWPSFWEAQDNALEVRQDLSHGMQRLEVRCRGCGAHLGHVFPDGPPPTGRRYCINSVALDFQATDS